MVERGWVGAAGGMVGRWWNGNKLNVDMHAGLPECVRVAVEWDRKKAAGEISGREKGRASG